MNQAPNDVMYSTAEREIMLSQMRLAAQNFYAAAISIRNHPFIEFNGLMQEYIKLCEAAHKKGIDFTQCNIHSGQVLPLESFHAAYLDEKLGCIFSGQLKVVPLVPLNPSDRGSSPLAKPAEYIVGDEVTWRSSAAGSTKTKTGKVVAVVRADDNPRKCVPPGLKLDGGGLSRDHRSYLVQVGGSKNLYWPRVSQLHLVRGAAAGN